MTGLSRDISTFIVSAQRKLADFQVEGLLMSTKKMLSAVLFVIVSYLLLEYVTHDIRYEYTALFMLNLLFFFANIIYAAFAILAMISIWVSIIIVALSARDKLIKQQVEKIATIISYPGKPFLRDRNLMRNINRRISAEYNINILFQSIVKHMGLSENSLELYIVHSQFDSFEARSSRAGQYQKSYYGVSEVELMLRRDYNFYHIAAILAHECAHHLLAQLQLEVVSPEILEMRTDITAIYTGFGEIIDKGYRGTRSTAKQLEVRLGYLKANEIGFAKLLTATNKLRRKKR